MTMLGKHQSEKQKKIISFLFKGRRLSEETKRKISLAKKGTPAWNKNKKCPQLMGERNGMYHKNHSINTKHLQRIIRKEWIKKNGHPKGMLGKRHSYSTKNKIRETIRKNKVNCGNRNGMFGKHHTLESRQNLSNKFSGSKNPSWRGGISKEPYSFDFTKQLKNKIKNRDSFKCILCGSIKNLKIHHIDYNKKNSSKMNLVSLCESCHTKTNYNRDFWKEKLYNINYIRYLESIDS